MPSLVEAYNHEKRRREKDISFSQEKRTKNYIGSHHSKQNNSVCRKRTVIVQTKHRPRVSSTAYLKKEGVIEASVNKYLPKAQFSCVTCTQMFSLYSRYQRHTKRGTCERYVCPYCKKVILHSTHLKNHIYTHTGEKLFSCFHCTKMFSRKDKLITHMRAHTINKPFNCNHCAKGYLHKDNLISHIRTSHREHSVTNGSSETDLFCCPM